ncbi:hypothetical protein [Kocuria sp.]|uniref:hypothetical protein n=1 Tax=Kocuria sp. TaxID=1871328 RepID=UPI0026DF0E95|nr:hypothetical protein [Kocuria sp.]MDO5618182.1 hypothetical protein [Kocuria sp.]
MKAPAYLRRTGAVVAAVAVLVLTGCRPGEEATDVTGRMNSSAPTSLQIQVAQGPGQDLTMAAGGVGSGRIGTATPENDPTTEAYLEEVDPSAEQSKDPSEMETPIEELGTGRHVVIVDDSDTARVATGRLDSGVANHPALEDGQYTIALLDVDSEGWISGIGVVDMSIANTSMTAAVPETHTRTLPVVVEQATAGELIINASPSAQNTSAEISWRMVGPDGESGKDSDSNRTTVELGGDGDYTLEIRAAMDGAPEVILQSVRLSFRVQDGQVTA